MSDFDSSATGKSLDKMVLEKAFNLMGLKALEKGRTIDLSVYGGCALMMAMNFRNATKDVDAAFEKDKDFVPFLVKTIANDMGLPEDWLNDAVKGYLSSKDSNNKLLFKSYPSEEEPGLRVFMPTPEYMLALKCIDIRMSNQYKDVQDVTMLAKACNVNSAEEAMEIIESFYPQRVNNPPLNAKAL